MIINLISKFFLFKYKCETCGKLFSNIDYIDDLDDDISRINYDSSFIDASYYEGYDEYFDE